VIFKQQSVNYQIIKLLNKGNIIIIIIIIINIANVFRT